MGDQLSLFFSEASEVVLIYSIKYERSCSEYQKLKLYRGVTDVVICSGNYMKCIPSCDVLIDSI